MIFTVSVKVKSDKYNTYKEVSHDCKYPPYFDQCFLCLETMEGEFLYVKEDLLEWFSWKEVKKSA